MSHLVSKLFRPIFEAKRSRSTVGGFLSVASLILTIGGYPFINHSQASALEPIENHVEVETPIGGPARLLPDMKTISQGYWSNHPGIDITAPLGSPIFPIKAGKVKEISISQYNYGRSIVLDHGDGTTSLYAHLGKVRVDEGDFVNEKTILGEVGMSGRTTGPHLHLEIRKLGTPQNPIKYLKTVLASR